MPMLPNGQMLPYGPQSGRAPFQPPGAAPGAGADLQALLGSPQLATAMQQGGGMDDPLAKIRETIAAVGSQGMAPAPAAPGMVDPKAAAAPLVRPANPMRGPLSGGSFPVRLPAGMAPGAPARPFLTSGQFRSVEQMRKPAPVA